MSIMIIKHNDSEWLSWREGVRSRVWSSAQIGANALHMGEQIIQPTFGVPVHWHYYEEHLTVYGGEAEVTRATPGVARRVARSLASTVATTALRTPVSDSWSVTRTPAEVARTSAASWVCSTLATAAAYLVAKGEPAAKPWAFARAAFPTTAAAVGPSTSMTTRTGSGAGATTAAGGAAVLEENGAIVAVAATARESATTERRGFGRDMGSFRGDVRLPCIRRRRRGTTAIVAARGH